jgi:hypothetical protein
LKTAEKLKKHEKKKKITTSHQASSVVLSWEKVSLAQTIAPRAKDKI